MLIKKEIALYNNETISIEYINSYFNSGDTSIERYNKYKISLILSNDISALTKNNVITCSKNSIIFFRPDELHFGRFKKAGTYSYLNIFLPLTFFEVFGDSLSSLNFLNDRSQSRINCINFDFENKIKLQAICNEILDTLNSSDSSALKLLSLVLQIIVICNEHYENQKNNACNQKLQPIVTTTMIYISENFEKNLSLNSLATNANCSVAYLSRVFKQCTGMTVYSYITSMRILKAKSMLKQGFSVTETYLSCGFNDCSNFINKFKKITGLTPGKFQKSFL